MSAPLRRATAVAVSVPGLLGVIAIGAFVYIAAHRIFYPYELDWLESGMVEGTRRLVDGLPLYTPPNVEYTQYPYPPVLYGVAAVFGQLFGVNFALLRVIAFVSTLGLFAVIYFVVRRETRSSAASLIAVGVYAATYKLAGTWFDVGKADSLFLFITLGATYWARRADTTRSIVGAALLMAVGVMTKQTALFSLLPIAIYLLVTKRKFGLIYAGVSIGTVLISTLILNIVSHGWFDYFVWKELLQQGTISGSKFDFFRVDLKTMWPVIPIVLFALPTLFNKERRWSTGFYMFALAGLIAGAWSSRLHSGGSYNVLMPAFATCAIALGIGMGSLLEKPRQFLLIGAAAVLASFQLYFLRYDVSAQIPTSHDQAVGDNFISWLKTVHGPVLVYSHPTYGVMAGKPSTVSQGGSEDVLRGKTAYAQADFQNSMANAIHQKRYAAIILDGPDDIRGFPADWLSYYVKLPGTAVTDNNAWHPITLITGHPTDVYVPIGSVPLTLPGA